MAKQFVVYYQKGTGTFVVTEPRPWAKENQSHFPDYNFLDNHPTTKVIQEYLVQNFGFEVGHKDIDISVIYNFDPNINFNK